MVFHLKSLPQYVFNTLLDLKECGMLHNSKSSWLHESTTTPSVNCDAFSMIELQQASNTGEPTLCKYFTLHSVTPALNLIRNVVSQLGLPGNMEYIDFTFTVRSFSKKISQNVLFGDGQYRGWLGSVLEELSSERSLVLNLDFCSCLNDKLCRHLFSQTFRL